MANEPRRLSILSSHEIDELFGLPNFSDDDRRLYFDLSAKIGRASCRERVYVLV